MRILYVEDEFLTASMIIDRLKSLGHDVVHGVGWVNNNPIEMLPRAGAMDEVFAVGDDAFDAAIVDYKLLGFFKGDEIVGYLTHILDKPCVGCSSETTFNAKMSDYGAVAVVTKERLRSELPALLAKLAEPLVKKPLPTPCR
jgi:hypothetical protein